MTKKKGFFRKNRILAFSITFVCAFALVGTAADLSKSKVVKSRDRSIELANSPVRILLKGNQTYRISLDGKSFSRELPQRHEIMLRHQVFDPLVNPPQMKEVTKAQAPGGVGLYIVQCVTQAIPAFQEEITAVGGEICGTVPYHSLIVAMSGETGRKVQAMPFVRWVGYYHPSFKLEQGLAKDVSRTMADVSTRYSIWLTKKNKKNEVAKFIESIGGEVVKKAKSRRMEAMLTRDQLQQVAALAQVLAVDLWTPIEDDMNNVREIGGANYLETVQGYTGQGVRAEVCDGGLRTTHVDFQANPPIIHCGNSTSTSHGTPVFGIVFGDGTGNSNARGMIPDAEQPIFAAYSCLSDRYAHTEELVNPGGSYRAVFQTNSWGNTRTLDYTTISAEMDEIIFDLDILICQSQSNAGDQYSRPQAWAKNIVSVGGVRHYNTLDRSDDCWCTSASIGPAEDGRIKPDVWHFYDYTLAPYYTSDTSYTEFGGTSGATPITAGHMGLIFQMWADGVFAGGPGLARDVFNYRPHAATAKALLIHSAYQYPFSGTSHDKTRMHQGWGMADVQNLYDMAQAHNWNFAVLIDESAVIAPLGTHTYNVTVDGTQPLKATLVYADPPGVPGAGVNRINDLSLKVTAPNGTTVYWGNNGLDIGVWSASGGSSNTIDTVENVFIQYPAAGNWTIQVLADEVVEDGHVETPGIDADYALIVSGGTSGQPPIADFTASSTVIRAGESVTFTDQSLNNPTSWSWTFEGGTPAASTAQNPTVTYNTAGTFNVTLTAANALGSDTETKVDYINVSEYCSSSGSSQSYEYIAGVAAADLNNPSGPSPYTDFTYLVAHLTQGENVNVSLTPGFPGGVYIENWKIWIDYNGDHDFEDAGEEVFSGSGSSIVSGSFTVPGSTIIGDTRMRVSMSYSTYIPYCGTFTYGEVEDYTVNIIDAEDLVVRASDARLLLFPFENGIFVGTGKQVGHGWNFTHYFVGHWNNDYPSHDLVVRKSNGELWLYPYRNETFYTYGSKKVGENFNYTHYFVGNWIDNGTDDLIVRDSNGYLWLFPYVEDVGFGAGINLGGGWNYTHYFVGNWSGNGTPDLICRDASGYMWYFRFDNGTFAPRKKVGNGWNFINYFVGNWTNDGTDDLIVRDSYGTVRLYPFRYETFYIAGSGKIVAAGWNFTHYFVGDWKNNGTDDMIVRDSNGNLKLYLFENETFLSGTTAGTGFNYTHYFVGQWTNQ